MELSDSPTMKGFGVGRGRVALELVPEGDRKGDPVVVESGNVVKRAWGG